MIFDSARQKIARAQRYAVELNSMEQSFLKEKCSGVITEIDSTSGDKIGLAPVFDTSSLQKLIR